MLIEPDAKKAKSALLRYAPHYVFDVKKMRKVSATAKCQGCGEEMSTDKVPEDLQWVITKRGTAVFFHEKCAGRVWGRKIPV